MAGVLFATGVLSAVAEPVRGWLAWRGPEQSGMSRETGLPDHIDPAQPLWRAEFPGQSTPVIANLAATDLPWTRMVVTIQYEVALRMQAEPRSEAYGALSVWLQSQCHVEILKKLGPTVFWPRPKVDSAVVLLTPDPEKRQAIGDREFFHNYLRGAFNHRRKLFRSVLHGLYPALSKPEIDDLLHGCGLVESARAEELDVVTHVALAAGLRKRLAEKQELMRRGAEAACDSVES